MNTATATDPQTGIAVGSILALDAVGYPTAEVVEIAGAGLFSVIVADEVMRFVRTDDVIAIITPAGFVLEDGSVVEAL